MILVSPPYRTNWGCLLADSGTIAGKLLDQLRDALVCSYYVRCVSTQRFLADVSVNHSRTGAVKLLITRRTSQSSKLLRVPFAGLQPVPGGRNWLRSSPRSKRMTRLAPRVLCSRAVSVAMPAHAVGTLDARAEPTWPRQAFSSIAAMYPVLASATAPAISGALSTRPNVDGVAGRIQRSELLPSRDALRA